MMEKQDFSSGEAKLVRLAANLYNGSMEVTPQELINTLDDRNYDLAMQAIRFRRYGCHIENLLDRQKDMEADIEIDVETDMDMENDFELLPKHLRQADRPPVGYDSDGASADYEDSDYEYGQDDGYDWMEADEYTGALGGEAAAQGQPLKIKAKWAGSGH